MIRPALFVVLLSISAALAQPVINSGGIVNAASYAVAGEPNAAIAQGSVFTLFGSNFGPVTANPVQATRFPLPTSAGLDGVTASITVGTTTRNAILLWVWNKGNTTGGWESALTAILPYDVPTGNATIAVTYQGQTSPAASVTVVQSSFGIFTVNQGGSGPAIVTDSSHTSAPYKVLSPINVASSGDNLTVWGTGLGAYAENFDQTNPPPAAVNVQSLVNAVVYVGTTPVVPTYTGHSGAYPGLDQINFVMPPNVSGCYVPIAVVIGQTVSNFGTLAVNTSSSGAAPACSDQFGLNAEDFGILQTKGTFNFGTIELQRVAAVVKTSTQNTDTAIAYFQTINAASLAQTAAPLGVTALGSCWVQQFTGPNSPFPPFVGTGLDAGSIITVAGPKTNGHVSETTVGQYFVPNNTGTLAGGFLDTAGVYKFTGTGGADVGSFTADVNFPPANAITWTNMSLTSLDRTRSQEIDWTGGDPSGGVEISGISFSGTSATSASAQFNCFAKASDGRFTIPAFVLEAMPAGSGTVTVSQFGVDSFTAPGLDQGFTMPIAGTQLNVTFK